MSFGYRFVFILRRRLPVLHNKVIKIEFGTFNVFSQERLAPKDLNKKKNKSSLVLKTKNLG